GPVVLGEGDELGILARPASALGHVLRAGTVAVLARHPLAGTARLLEEEPSHLRVGELVVRVLVAALAGLGADEVGLGGRRGRLGRRGGAGRLLRGLRGAKAACDDESEDDQRRSSDANPSSPTSIHVTRLRAALTSGGGRCPTIVGPQSRRQY